MTCICFFKYYTLIDGIKQHKLEYIIDCSDDNENFWKNKKDELILIGNLWNFQEIQNLINNIKSICVDYIIYGIIQSNKIDLAINIIKNFVIKDFQTYIELINSFILLLKTDIKLAYDFTNKITNLWNCAKDEIRNYWIIILKYIINFIKECNLKTKLLLFKMNNDFIKLTLDNPLSLYYQNQLLEYDILKELNVSKAEADTFCYI